MSPLSVNGFGAVWQGVDVQEQGWAMALQAEGRVQHAGIHTNHLIVSDFRVGEAEAREGGEGRARLPACVTQCRRLHVSSETANVYAQSPSSPDGNQLPFSSRLVSRIRLAGRPPSPRLAVVNGWMPQQA